MKIDSFFTTNPRQLEASLRAGREPSSTLFWYTNSEVPTIDPYEVLDLLGSLVGKSLVVTEDVDGQMRYRLLESVREYATDRLQASGEESTVKASHTRHFLAVVEEAAGHVGGHEQGYWMDRLESEHDNLRSALAWSLSNEDGAPSGLRMGGALWRFWISRGHWSEGLEQLERALEADKSKEPTAARAYALRGTGAVASSLGDFSKANARFQDCLVLYQSLGDEHGVAQALQSLGFVARNQGDYESAQTKHEECLRVFEKLNDAHGVAWTHLQLGYVANDRGDLESAQRHYEQAVQDFKAFGDKRGEANALVAIGALFKSKGDFGSARSSLQFALEIFEELKDSRGIGWAQISLGFVDAQQGDLDSGRLRLEQGLELFVGLGDRDGIAYALEGLAATAREQDPGRAVRLWSAATALRHAIGAPLPLNERQGQEEMVDQSRAQLGDLEFETAWSEGLEMGFAQAMAFALTSDWNQR